MSALKQLFQSKAAFVVAATAGLAACAATGGPNAMIGFGLGVFGAGFNILAMRWVVGLAADYAASPNASPKPTKMTMLIVMAFFVKLPVFVGLGLYSKTLGNVALPCFLWGIGLVYFALVGWATATS